MSKITFAEPRVVSVKRVIQYEIRGVAFIEGYDKTVGFTIESEYGSGIRLIMEDLVPAKELYNFFNTLLQSYAEEKEGLSKSFGQLYASWHIPKERQMDMIKTLGESMGSGWHEALRKIISVYRNI